MAGNSDWKFSTYRLIGTAGMILILAFSVFQGGLGFSDSQTGWPFDFVHAPSVIGIIGLTFFLLLGTFESDFLRFIPASLKTLCFTPREPNLRFAEIARFASRYAIGAGVVYALIALIAMFRHLSSPDRMAWAIVVGLLPVLYAVILAEVFFALVYKAFSGQSDQNDSKPLSVKGIALAMAVVGLILVRFFVALISFSEAP
ncbi:MAG: hypothetical protein ACYS8Z_03745 [Planctomycetota bacterium]